MGKFTDRFKKPKNDKDVLTHQQKANLEKLFNYYKDIFPTEQLDDIAIVIASNYDRLLKVRKREDMIRIMEFITCWHYMLHDDLVTELVTKNADQLESDDFDKQVQDFGNFCLSYLLDEKNVMLVFGLASILKASTYETVKCLYEQRENIENLIDELLREVIGSHYIYYTNLLDIRKDALYEKAFFDVLCYNMVDRKPVVDKDGEFQHVLLSNRQLVKVTGEDVLKDAKNVLVPQFTVCIHIALCEEYPRLSLDEDKRAKHYASLVAGVDVDKLFEDEKLFDMIYYETKGWLDGQG